jgi:branched-chain amino acid aminotransferase
LYGEGIYETLRTYNKKPFLFDRHFDRFQLSAQMIGLPMPVDEAGLMARIDETLDAWKGAGEAYIRVLLTRGVGELTYDPAACPTPTLVVIVKDHADVPAAMVDNGVKVALVSVLRNHPGTVNPIIKSNNLLNNALAMQEGLRSGAFESLMKNYRGELAECSQSNLFLVRDGVVMTPAVGSGLLRGVTRDFIFELGEQIGVPVREAVLFEQDLDGAQEAFFTSTTKELVPIISVGSYQIGDGRPGPITKKLLVAFRQKTQELTRDPQPQT